MQPRLRVCVGGRGGLAPSLNKGSTKGPWTVCSEFLWKQHFSQCCLRTCPFPFFHYDLTKPTIFYKICSFPTLNDDRAAQCPALKNYLPLKFFVQASVPSWKRSPQAQAQALDPELKPECCSIWLLIHVTPCALLSVTILFPKIKEDKIAVCPHRFRSPDMLGPFVFILLIHFFFFFFFLFL